MNSIPLQASTPVPTKRREKHFDAVDWPEVQSLLDLLDEKGVSEVQAVSAIGYVSPSGSLSQWRGDGACKRVVKYALLGLIAERGFDDKTTFTVSFSEAELLFDVVRKARASMPDRAPELAKVQAKIAAHLTVLS